MLNHMDNMLLRHRWCIACPAMSMQQRSSCDQLPMKSAGTSLRSKRARVWGNSVLFVLATQSNEFSARKQEGCPNWKTAIITNVAARNAPTSPTSTLLSLSEDIAVLSESAVAFLQQQQSTNTAATDSFLDNLQAVKQMLSPLVRQGGTLYEIANVLCQLQRMGLDIFFKSEIRELLERLYRTWKSISGDHAATAATDTDLGVTAMAFSLLRSYGFDVTPEPLASFSNDGKLFGGTGLPREDGASRVASVLHLKCATDLMFPGEEDILGALRLPSTRYLSEAVESNSQIPSTLASQATKFIGPQVYQLSFVYRACKIQHELVFHWYRKIPMVETLQYLKIYKDGDPWTASSAIRNLAIEYLNFWQPRLLDESKIIDRWNKHSRIPEIAFARDMAELLSLMMMSTIPEPQYRANRLALIKMGCIGYVVDDLFDEHGSLDELRTFAECMRRWDPSLPERFPEPVKVLYNTTLETTKHLAQQASVVQGRDLHPYFQTVISRFVDSQLVEAEWAATNHKPSFAEYMENALISVAINLSNSLAIFFRVQLSEEQVNHEDYIKLYRLMSSMARCMNDIDGYKRDKTFDGHSNVVEIIMRESAGGTIGEAEAADKLLKLIEQRRAEVLQLLLTSKAIPVDAKGLFLMSIRISLLSTDTSHPFAKCLQGRPEQMPDNTRSWSVPVLRELNKQLEEISSL